MRYKLGDKVRVKSLAWYNENKDEYGCVYCGDGMIFCDKMQEYCGKIMTISRIKPDPCDPDIGHYLVKENSAFWTDKMFEGLAQEYPKIAIQGDPAKGVSVIDALVALGGENEKDVIASTKHACYFIDHDGKIRSRLLENLPEGFKLYTLEEWRKENMEKENADKKELLLGLVETQKGQELIPHKDYEIKQDGDKFYLVKKKKEYPKTYGGCCDTLYRNSRHDECYEACLQGYPMQTFARLLICRDAYWKIAGEEMGLGKPWKPDWTDLDQLKYCIWVDVGEFITMTNVRGQHILAFPTEEMRDAFKENFDPDIEICKEFL